MSALYAGLLCTLLLIGAIAALFGCMSAARCLRRSSFALCLAITGLDFAPLAAALQKLKLEPYIVSESAGTQAEDALAMKRTYEEILQR